MNATSNLPAVNAASVRAARFLVPPAESPADQAAARAEAAQHLDRAVRALVRAGCDAAALAAVDAEATLARGA